MYGKIDRFPDDFVTAEYESPIVEIADVDEPSAVREKWPTVARYPDGVRVWNDGEDPHEIAREAYLEGQASMRYEAEACRHAQDATWYAGCIVGCLSTLASVALFLACLAYGQ